MNTAKIYSERKFPILQYYKCGASYSSPSRQASINNKYYKIIIPELYELGIGRTCQAHGKRKSNVLPVLKFVSCVQSSCINIHCYYNILQSTFVPVIFLWSFPIGPMAAGTTRCLCCQACHRNSSVSFARAKEYVLVVCGSDTISRLLDCSISPGFHGLRLGDVVCSQSVYSALGQPGCCNLFFSKCERHGHMRCPTRLNGVNFARVSTMLF